MVPGQSGGLDESLVPVDGEEAVVPALAPEGEGGVGGALEPRSLRPCGGGVWGT